jgi:hypothetical protein
MGNDFLLRQVATLGGGTTEWLQCVSERARHTRELSHDRDAFRDVPRATSKPEAERRASVSGTDARPSAGRYGAGGPARNVGG